MGVRRENHLLMAGFLAICFIYIACWSLMFSSQVYRYTFVSWPFFALLTVASFIILFGTATAAILSWINFGKGLAHYRECIILSSESLQCAHVSALVHVKSVLSKADFAGEVFPHKDLKGNTLSVFGLGETIKIANKSKIDDDWINGTDILGSPGGRTVTSSRVYSISLKDIAAAKSESRSDDTESV